VPATRYAVGGLFVLLVLGAIVYGLARPTFGHAGVAARPIDGIPCDQSLQVSVHFHVHLDILARGHPTTVPAGIGIPAGGACFYWIHTHDSSGVIHIEAPVSEVSRTFTLGNFLDIWTNASLAPNAAIVDGLNYVGDPRDIVLKPHELITLESGPPYISQPAFHFPQGL
jgi:hypothetical protein